MYKTLRWSALLVTLASCSDPAEVAIPGESELVELRTETLDLPGLGVQEVTYELVDGQAIFQGDIVLDLDNLRVDSEGVSTRGAGRRNEAARWVGGVVPYTIDPALPDPARVTGAMAHIASQTPIFFVLRTNQPDYLTFRPSTECISFPGRVGGQQVIGMAPHCRQGNAVHEIGHALGLFHEQSRLDRDTYVTINWANIEPGYELYFKNYTQQGYDGWDNGPYDYESRMHYQWDAASIAPGTKATIVRKDGQPLTPNPDELSAGDILTIKRMYPRFAPSGAPQLQSNFGGAISSWGKNRLDMYAVATDGSLRHQYCNGSCTTTAGWSGWVDNWGDGLTGGVDAVSWGPNRIDAVARALNNSVWHFWWDNGALGWEDLGMQMRAGADCSISSWSARNLDIFCIGTDNKLKHKAYRSDTGWHAWQNLGGVLTAGVDSVSWGPNRIDIVSRNSSSRLVHMAWNGGWSSWVDRGGSLAGTPTISAGGTGHFDIFAPFVGGTICKRSYELGWELDFATAGYTGSEPDTVSWKRGRIDMALRSTSGKIQHAFVDNNLD